MTVLDYFVLLIVVASVASGATKGIIRVIVSVAFTVAGLVVAAHAYTYAASLLRIFVAARLADLLGFVAVFLLVFVAGSLASRWLRGGLKRARLSWIDRVLGAAFGFFRGWLICSVIYLALTAFPLKPEAVERATFGPALLEGTRVIAYLTSRELRERFFSGYEAVKQLWGQKS
ncbi:MAG TPA: CvpA family protein [Blastocatellia bacterium]|nr:CvpA family protein [Blastocatellia bacterium]